MIGSSSRWRSIVFDCDGVVLDSNRLKTNAFYSAALTYGPAEADALVAHHLAHGGVSRYAKFDYFLNRIVPGRAGPDREALLTRYAEAVRRGLMTCRAAAGLDALRAATPGVRWLIASGGDQAELRKVLTARGLAAFFNGGIFGSPDDKDAILARELGRADRPALFLGDSRYDWEAARRHDVDFVFIAEWSEWQEGSELAAQGAFPAIARLEELLDG